MLCHNSLTPGSVRLGRGGELVVVDWRHAGGQPPRAADTINDLRVPPGNRHEKLTGDREGQYSIHVNDQYRICFVWTASGPDEVEITDYH